MNPNEKKAEEEVPLVRPVLPDVPEGKLTVEDWYAYKDRWRHYDFERLRRGLITQEQLYRENPLAQMGGDLRTLMRNARIDFTPAKLPDDLQRMADERARAALGEEKADDARDS